MTTNREQQILALIRKYPMISQQILARKLGISRSAVAGHIMKLTNKGIIKGRAYVFSDAPFIAAIGGANMDITGAPAQTLRQQDSNPGTVHASPGGVARNIAENLARLSVDCRLISVVGNDPHGQLLLQHCRDAGVDIQHVSQIDSAQTSTYLSVLDESGDMYVAVNDMTIIESMGPEQLRPQEAMLKQASVIILDTNLRGDTLAWLSETFAQQTLFVDTVSTSKAMKIKPYLNTIHTLKTNRFEAEALSGLSTKTQTDRRKLANWIHKQGVKRLFLTLGEGGVFYSTVDDQGTEKLNKRKRIIRNAGGAGDAFLAGIAYAWLKDWSLMKSIKFGLASADVTLSDRASSSPNISVAAVNRVYRSVYAN